jgi:hypothetical protein
MKRYWAFQLAGWLGYSAVGITINLLGGGKLGPLLVGHAVLVSCGIGLTHLLRREIHQRRSPDAPISRLWPLLVPGTIAISSVLTALVIGVNKVLTPGNWDLISTGALWWGMLLATGVWTILYVRFSERRGQEIRESHLLLALRESQLLALEAQINPHFLFNALNSIRALVEIDPGRAQDMLTRLSNVLRNSLRRDNEHTVTLGSELEAVSDYLALETIRFADRLHSSVVTGEGAAGCRIPPMVLQTLVENAVKHGIGQAKGRAELLIQSNVDGQNLVITVENTGKLVNSREDGGQLGLRNTQERLKLLYGDRARLRLGEKGDRVIATVAVPVAG